jgi:RNA polymerase sigma-70 factor (ECF subfamily)
VATPLPEQDLLRVYRETIKPLYLYVSRRVGGDRTLAEDLVQETWMRALDAWPAKGLPDEPLAWLYRVARNILVSHFRRVRPEPMDPALIDLQSAMVAVETREGAAAVSWALARLRRGHADVIGAFYFDGKSVREIARESGRTERAVEGRLRRARAVLKKQLERLQQQNVKRDIKERSTHVSPTRTS